MILVVRRVVLGLKFDAADGHERLWAQVVPKMDLGFNRMLLLGVSWDYFGRPGGLRTVPWSLEYLHLGQFARHFGGCGWYF